MKEKQKPKKPNSIFSNLLLIVPLAFLLTACAKEKSLSEVYTDKTSISFLENFDPDNIVSVSYYRDEMPTVETEDKELIQKIYNGVTAITVTGRYRSTMRATDSASSITFTLKDGTSVVIHFDFGKLSVNGVLYECDNKKELNQALFELETM